MNTQEAKVLDFVTYISTRKTAHLSLLRTASEHTVPFQKELSAPLLKTFKFAVSHTRRLHSQFHKLKAALCSIAELSSIECAEIGVRISAIATLSLFIFDCIKA